MHLCLKTSPFEQSVGVSYENEFDLHENELRVDTHFHFECFRVKTGFYTEAKENSGMPIVGPTYP